MTEGNCRQETNSFPSQLFFLTGHKEEESRKSVAGLLRKLCASGGRKGSLAGGDVFLSIL
jgi:hypothetical protein